MVIAVSRYIDMNSNHNYNDYGNIDLEELVKIREYLEKKKEELKIELERIEKLLSIVDNIITQESFKTATEYVEEIKTPAKETTEKARETKLVKAVEAPLRRNTLFSWRGTTYATMELYRDRVVVNISKDLKLSVDSRLVNYLKRELDRYFEEDLRRAEEGVLDSSKRFIYTIDESEGFLTQIEFYDYGNEERRRDLLSKIRWVLRTHARETLG